MAFIAEIGTGKVSLFHYIEYKSKNSGQGIAIAEETLLLCSSAQVKLFFLQY
jgi:hypothetical protein